MLFAEFPSGQRLDFESPEALAEAVRYPRWNADRREVGEGRRREVVWAPGTRSSLSPLHETCSVRAVFLLVGAVTLLLLARDQLAHHRSVAVYDPHVDRICATFDSVRHSPGNTVLRAAFDLDETGVESPIVVALISASILGLPSAQSE